MWASPRSTAVLALFVGSPWSAARGGLRGLARLLPRRLAALRLGGHAGAADRLVQILYSGGTFTGRAAASRLRHLRISVDAWFRIAGVCLVLLTAAAWLFVRSDVGRVLVAIRENEQRCAYLGIDAPRVKILLLVASAVVAVDRGLRLCRLQWWSRRRSASFVFGTELVIWVALGGRGTLIGPVIGTIAIDVISAYLSGNLPFIWKLVIGFAFVLVIVALPQGIVPVLRDRLRRLWSAPIGTASCGLRWRSRH